MGKIFGEILSMSVDSAWLIIGVIIVRAVLNKSPKYFRKILWALVGLRLMVPFSFKSVFSLIPNETQQVTDSVVSQVVQTPVESTFSFFDIVPFIWVAVSMLFLFYGIISYIRLKLKIMDGVLLNGNIYQSEKIESPFVCGFIHPKIYVPYGLDEMTQKCVLLHEETHIKYADHFIKAVGFVVLCIHWFNPLVWIAYFLLCKDIELSCDESVIKKCNSAQCQQYAKALLELGVNKVSLSACPVAFGEVSIKTRIKSVVSYKKASKVLVLISFCMCIGVSVCFMTESDVPLKEKTESVEVAEETTEPAYENMTEGTTEPFTEIYTEIHTEIETEPTTGIVTSVATEEIIENYDVETTSSFLVLEPPSFRNPFDTTHYVRPDPMRENAMEAGVFVNENEKDVLISVLENNGSQTE